MRTKDLRKHEENKKNNLTSVKSLELSIHQDENRIFFGHYDRLGRLEREIWKLAVWWVKRFPSAHPCQHTIAKKAKCSREHVNRTFSKFKKLGWIYLHSRGKCRSKVIGIPSHLKMIDLVNREYFERLEITSKITHSYSNNRRFTSRGTGEIFKDKIKSLDPSPLGKDLGFSLDGQLKLSLYPEFIQQEALRKARELGRFGWRPTNQERYFLGIVSNLAGKQQFKPKWRRFYKSKEDL